MTRRLASFGRSCSRPLGFGPNGNEEPRSAVGRPLTERPVRRLAIRSELSHFAQDQHEWTPERGGKLARGIDRRTARRGVRVVAVIEHHDAALELAGLQATGAFFE